MTVSTRAASISLRPAIAGAALALAILASLLGGVVGGIVAGVVAPDSPTTGDNPQVVVLDPKWVEYGNAWEARYRQMYPESAR
jgi:hypothetical protein